MQGGLIVQEDPTLDIRRRRAVYRATHRGTKEMDWLLGRYVEANVEVWTAAELDGIETLIELGDPELNAWILEPSPLGEDPMRPMIEAIRRFHGLVAES